MKIQTKSRFTEPVKLKLKLKTQEFDIQSNLKAKMNWLKHLSYSGQLNKQHVIESR